MSEISEEGLRLLLADTEKRLTMGFRDRLRRTTPTLTAAPTPPATSAVEGDGFRDDGRTAVYRCVGVGRDRPAAAQPPQAEGGDGGGTA